MPISPPIEVPTQSTVASPATGLAENQALPLPPLAGAEMRAISAAASAW
jgi:hypothetical protein